MNKFKIDECIRKIAIKNKNEVIYPAYIKYILQIPLRDIIDRLSELVEIGDLELKFEIKCENDSNILLVTNDYSEYLQTKMYCRKCNKYIKITLNNIVPVYYLK